MKVAIYGRVSTKDQGQDVRNQLLQLRDYCGRSGWQIVAEYIDHESAKTGNREAFKRLYVDASRRAFDVVLVWALDRFVREGIGQTFDYIRVLKGHGVDFESFTEPHFRTTGHAGELMLAVAAWVARMERQRISERTLAGLRRARQAGRVGGRPKVVVDKVRLVHLGEQGWSTRKIAAEMGISPASVSRLLKPRRLLDSAAPQ